MSGVEALHAHLRTGATTVARCWALTRTDGVTLGFTDHDLTLHFEGIAFHPNTGMTAAALQQSTGLSVDNTEAVGALSHDAITERDIAAGRYDGAKVTAWRVNWADVAEREVQFRGSLGEIERSGQAFTAELRGLAEVLNQPQGRLYQKTCSAVLGDKACGFDVNMPGYAWSGPLVRSEALQTFWFDLPNGFAPDWFVQGRLTVESGEAEGQVALIKTDDRLDGLRVIKTWEQLRAPIAEGDHVRLIAGCDKRAGSCRLKFNNFLNFQGFPHIPGDDWMTSYPRSSDPNRGGSLTGSTE